MAMPRRIARLLCARKCEWPQSLLGPRMADHDWGVVEVRSSEHLRFWLGSAGMPFNTNPDEPLSELLASPLYNPI